MSGGAPVELTRDTFDAIVGDGLVFIDFWAAWCGPCRRFAPVFEATAARHPDVTFAKVDTDAEQELSAAFGISSIPTLMIVKDGVVLFAQPGALPEPALEELVGKARAVDMDEVRRQLAERGASG